MTDDVKHLTILGDRQAGKTRMMVDVAVDEGGRQGRRVLFSCQFRDQEAWVLKDIEERTRYLLGEDEVQRVSYTNGKQKIFFASGGSVQFQISQSDERKRIQTHIIDDADGGYEALPSATHVFRTVLR